MPLPTRDELLSMGYAYRGRPFVRVLPKDTITLLDMGYAYRGRPFVTAYQPAPSTFLPRIMMF